MTVELSGTQGDVLAEAMKHFDRGMDALHRVVDSVRHPPRPATVKARDLRAGMVVAFNDEPRVVAIAAQLYNNELIHVCWRGHRCSSYSLDAEIALVSA